MAGRQLTIGRCGEVEIGDNPYLHGTFAVVLQEVPRGGCRARVELTATVADDDDDGGGGLFQAWFALVAAP